MNLVSTKLRVLASLVALYWQRKCVELVKQEHEGEVLQDMTELLLMYAARVQLVENVIKPALEKGSWVVGDAMICLSGVSGGGRQSHVKPCKV